MFVKTYVQALIITILAIVQRPLFYLRQKV
jgi:hypothetical protein